MFGCNFGFVLSFEVKLDHIELCEGTLATIKLKKKKPASHVKP